MLWDTTELNDPTALSSYLFSWGKGNKNDNDGDLETAVFRLTERIIECELYEPEIVAKLNRARSQKSIDRLEQSYFNNKEQHHFFTTLRTKLIETYGK